MPVRYTYVENGGVLLTGTGKVSGEAILEVNRAIYATPEMIMGIRCQIRDYTAVGNWRISGEEIRMIAEQDKRAAEVNPAMVVAVAAREQIAFGLSRMWVGLCGQRSFTYACVSNR